MRLCNLLKTENNRSNTLEHITQPFVYLLFLLVTHCRGVRAASLATTFLPTGAHLALPQGFKPQAPPNKPMLLPFVTPAPNSPSGGWKPIVGSINTTPIHRLRMSTRKPQMQSTLVASTNDCCDTVLDEGQGGTVVESIVYGAWKPVPPLKPDAMQTTPMSNTKPDRSTKRVNNTERHSSSSSENQSIQRPNPGSPAMNATTVRKILDNRRVFNTRRRVQANNSALEFPKFNISNTKLFETSTQINNSFDVISLSSTPPQPTKKITPTKATQISEGVTKTETETESITEPYSPSSEPKNIWPTNLIPTLEQHKQNYTQAEQNFNLNFAEGTSNLTLPQMPLNITRVGLPYEEKNAAEEPTICVPIALIEEPNQMEIERVYCFPLPPPLTTEAPMPKGVKAKVVNYTEYVAENGSEKLTFKCLQFLGLSLTAMIFLKHK